MEYSNHTVNELKGGSISSRIGTFSGNIYGSRRPLENILKHDTMVVDLECDGHRVHSKRRCFRRLKQVMDYYKEIIQH